MRAACCLAAWLVTTSVSAEVTLTTLVSFNGGNGSEPWCALVQGADRNFYGTTSFGGASGGGTVFKMSPAGTITTLYSFGPTNANGAQTPQAGLTFGADGQLYGTTRDAARDFYGTIFRITPDGDLTLLFSFHGSDGAHPWAGALVQGSDGSFYGTTASGGNLTPPPGAGTVFRVGTNGAFNSLHQFNFTDGFSPYGGLVEGPGENLYGATCGGGLHAAGTIFKISLNGYITTLVTFDGTNGFGPFSALLQGPDGNFYGTTTQGGSSYGDPRSVNGEGFGTIFKMTPEGRLTTLFSFDGTNGSYPYASLTEGKDGYLYGTTLSGGAYTNELFPSATGYAGYGTVFRIATNGELTTLISFDNTNGAEPIASLVLGADGRFYGTTIMGGGNNLGTVFRLDIPSPLTVSCSAPATVECGVPADVIAHVSDANGNALAVVWTINGDIVQTNMVPAGNPPSAADVSLSADLPLGANVVAVSVADTAMNTASCSTNITVVDSIPPKIVSASAQPNILWPPNHQMVLVRVYAQVIDRCSPTSWKIIAVQSDESVNGRGDGNTAPDWIITGDHTVKLRAERSGNRNGRTYFITIQAIDAAGNLSAPAIVKVNVPKNPGRVK